MEKVHLTGTAPGGETMGEPVGFAPSGLKVDRQGLRERLAPIG